MDVWQWISDLCNSQEWTTSNSPLVYELASTNPMHGEGQSIEVQAERVISKSGLDTGKWATFSIQIVGFEADTCEKTLWVSDACPLLSDKPFIPLLLQLIQEIVDQGMGPKAQKLKPEAVSWILETHSAESLSAFFSLVFLTRLFWLCSFDAPSAVGSFYFDSFLEPNLELLAHESHMPVLKAFFLSSGIDVERCVSRAIGYMMVKCLVLKEMSVGLKPVYNMGLSYATEAHGLWLLRSYAPVWSMKPTRSKANTHPFLVGAKECALRYSLAHQQLESVVQLEYSVTFNQDHIQVKARVDNLRFHVVRLGFNSGEDVEYGQETYFPSRIRVWIGPELGSNYVTSLSLGKSTREVETQRGKLATSMRTKTRRWRWDQDAEGNMVLYDGVLCDTTAGVELYASKPGQEDEFRRRYQGGNRAFTKSKGVVFTGDECGEEVRWRVSKEMEGSVLKWRIGGKVWLSYCPTQVKTSFCETRCMDWCDEVDLPLISN